MMKKQRLIGCIVGLALCAGLFAGCAQNSEADSGSAEGHNAFVEAMQDQFGSAPPNLSAPAPDSSAGMEAGEPVTQAEAEQALRAYYPEGVELTFDGERSLHGKPAYIFAVMNPEGKLVSRAAMTASTGQAWIYDMHLDTGLDENWYGPEKYGLDEPFVKSEPTPYYVYSPHGPEAGAVFAFGDIDTVPELSPNNEGTAVWYGAEQRLELRATLVNGTTTGAPEGPRVELWVSWAGGQPVIESAEFFPAAIYSNPRLAMESGRELFIEDARLLELAEYLRGIVEKGMALYPDAEENVELETIEALTG